MASFDTTIGDLQDTQEVKSKGPYKKWFEPEHQMLLRLLVEEINQRLRNANGKFNKLVETRFFPTIHKHFGTNKTYTEYRNRMKILKGMYNSLSDLLRFSFGFGGILQRINSRLDMKYEMTI